MARNDATISIVQFDGTALSHLAVTPSGTRFQIVSQNVEPVAVPLDGAALRAFVDRCGANRDALYTVLPRHQVTLRLLTFPSQEPQEIAAMVDLSAGEYVPFPRESLVVRHQVIATMPGGESRVMLVLLHRDVLDQHLSLLSDAGLEPREIFLSTTCIHAAATAAPNAPADRFALVHLSVAGLEIAILENGQLLFSRGVLHERPWDLNDPHNRETLLYEIRDALSGFRRESEDGLGVETLFLANEGHDVAPFAALLDEATGKSCHPADFLGELVVSARAGIEGIPLVGLGAALSALGRAQQSITLSPPALARDRSFRAMKRHALRAAVLAGVILLALCGWFVQAVVQRALLIDELEARAATLAPGAQGIAEKRERLQIISRQVDRDGGFLPLLASVAKAAPETGFNITRIEYNRDSGMNVWGRAMTKDLVLSDFLGALRGMGQGSLAMLAKAHSQYERAGRERDRVVVDYHVSVPVLEVEDDAVATNR